MDITQSHVVFIKRRRQFIFGHRAGDEFKGKDHHVALIPRFVKDGNLQSDDGELFDVGGGRTKGISLNIPFQLMLILWLDRDGIGKILTPSWLIHR